MKKLLIISILAIIGLGAQCQPDLKSYSEQKYQNDIDSLISVIVEKDSAIAKLNNALILCANELNKPTGDTLGNVFDLEVRQDSAWFRVYDDDIQTHTLSKINGVVKITIGNGSGSAIINDDGYMVGFSFKR